MQLGLAVAVALLIVAVVAWPLVVRRRHSGQSSTPGAASQPDHAAALSDVYDAIRTLQTDHGLGRVEEDDYRAQLDEYRRRAAQILREMDRESGESGRDD